MNTELEIGMVGGRLCLGGAVQNHTGPKEGHLHFGKPTLALPLHFGIYMALAGNRGPPRDSKCWKRACEL